MRRFAFLFVTIWLLVIMPRPVHAYLDPGSGSLLLQALLGGIAGLLVLLKVYWRRLVARFKGGKTDPDGK